MSVTAYLTRQGFDPISGTLNLLTDSTADINLNNIPSGGWHLKVDAADSMGVVKYSGQTDVNVIENQTIQVTLTLVPVPGGVGNIYLYVTWGNPSNGWNDFPGNPVLTGIYNGYESYGVYQAYVMKDGNTFKMWFNGLNGDGAGVIEYAESNDGIHWLRPINHPVLLPGNGWDNQNVSLPTVIKEDSLYRMYYQGRASLYGPWHIGLATSSDGINWTKHPNPVLYATSGWELQIQPTDIVKKDGVYYLYYDGVIYDYNVQTKVGLATSTDGINFTRSPQNPVLSASQNWEGGQVFDASVIYEDGSFKMVYSSLHGYGLGEAASVDGINWTKSNTNPIFTPQQTVNHWTNWVAYSHLRKFDNEYRIYYAGRRPDGKLAVGLVTKTL